MRVRVFDEQGQLTEPIDMPKVVRTDEEWQRMLTTEQYEVARGKGTERPFCGTLLDNKKEGVYACIGCGLPLFASASNSTAPSRGLARSISQPQPTRFRNAYVPDGDSVARGELSHYASESTFAR